MWPFDRKSSRDCVRISSVAVERWTRVANGFQLAASRLLEPGALDSLAQSLRAVLPAANSETVGLVVESAWLPLILVDTGGVLWSKAQAEALVRHRLRLLYDAGPGIATTWTFRVDHRAGDRFALGAGLPVDRRESLLGAAREAGLRWTSLMPAFEWGWQQLQPHRALPRGTGWFVWIEHDRAVVGRVERGRLTGFNAGAALCENDQGVEQLIEVEAFRLGVDSRSESVVVGSWRPGRSHAGRSGQSRIHWRSLARGKGPGPDHLAATPSAQMVAGTA